MVSRCPCGPRLAAAFLLSIALSMSLACAPASESPPGQQPAQVQAVPSVGTPGTTPEPAVQTANNPGCIEAGISDILSEFAANPFRARDMYVGEIVCLHGEITIHIRENNYIGARVKITADTGAFSIRLVKAEEWALKTPRADYEREWEEWEGWVMSSSVGDRVDFRCKITGLRDAKRGYSYPPGAPGLRDCARLSAQVQAVPSVGTPGTTPESNVQTANNPGCIEAGISDILSEFAANPFRARDMYVGEIVCLHGEITSHIGENNYIGARVKITADTGAFSIRLVKAEESALKTPRADYEREWEEWEGWVMSSSVGDRVDFRCKITGLRDAKRGYSYPPGAPGLRDCARLSASGE